MWNSFFTDGSWISRLLEMSLTASAVILVVLAARLLLRKAPRVYSYALWAVVAFRLICPISFSSQFSLLGLLDASVPEIVQSEDLPADFAAADLSEDILLPALTEPARDLLNPAQPTETRQPVPALLTGIWMAGVLALLIWALISYLSLRRKMRTAVLLEGNVFQSEHVRSPFILGLLRPRIYIPYALDDTALRCVLAHERCHLKRGDHMVKAFSFALLVIHWFNPLCWLAFYLMSRDMEMSCDEKVLSHGGSKKEYSTVLLSFAANRRFPAPCPLAFGETGAKSRIKNALKWKRPRTWVTVAAALACIALIAACAADPAADTAPTPDVDQPTEATDSTLTASDSDDAQAVAMQFQFQATWTHTPALSSGYPAFPFVFSMDYTRIEASCSAGQLLDLDGAGSSTMTYSSGQTLHWSPASGDTISVPSAVITFTVYNGDDVLCSGELLIEQTEHDDLSFTYTAVLSNCAELLLAQTMGDSFPSGGGGLRVRALYDLTKSGPIELNARELPLYRFTTNTTEIWFDFENNGKPITIDCYAADSGVQLLTFSAESGSLSSCSFTNLTSAEEYAFQCSLNTTLTVHDGITQSPQVHPVTGE